MHQRWVGSGNVRGRTLIALASASAFLLAACGGESEAPTDTSPPEAAQSSETSTSSTPPPPPTPAPVTAAQLPGLLPTLDELKTITDNPQLIEGPNSTGVAEPDPSQQVYEPANCASSFSAGAPPAYEG